MFFITLFSNDICPNMEIIISCKFAFEMKNIFIVRNDILMTSNSNLQVINPIQPAIHDQWCQREGEDVPFKGMVI
jgi:hypothetical protein